MLIAELAVLHGRGDGEGGAMDEDRDAKYAIGLQVRRQLCDIGVPPQLALCVAASDALREAIIRDGVDAWGKDVLRGFHLGRLRSARGIGETSIRKLNATLAKYFAEQPTQPQPSPASATAAGARAEQPDRVSYSIHVDNVHQAVALSWIASMMKGGAVMDDEAGSLAYILDSFNNCIGWEVEPDVNEELIRAMERLIEFIRTDGTEA